MVAVVVVFLGGRWLSRSFCCVQGKLGCCSVAETSRLREGRSERTVTKSSLWCVKRSINVYNIGRPAPYTLITVVCVCLCVCVAFVICLLRKVALALYYIIFSCRPIPGREVFFFCILIGGFGQDYPKDSTAEVETSAFLCVMIFVLIFLLVAPFLPLSPPFSLPSASLSAFLSLFRRTTTCSRS